MMYFTNPDVSLSRRLHVKKLTEKLDVVIASAKAKLDALNAVVALFSQSLELDLCHGFKLHEASVPGRGYPCFHSIHDKERHKDVRFV
jgi:hypothetical protein